ncbi:MAG TPA: type I-C CRISPR-associated protein Cas8c/Csd1 [Haloplasmataceae bacterium]
MGWMYDLYETYNNNLKAIDITQLDKSLLPISHSTQNAQIEIIIDEEGNFVDAKEVLKDDAVTLIPVTEDSVSRGNGILPHPLCDKLCYIAGDYKKFIKDKKAEFYDTYISQLEQWVNSDYSHIKIEAIYKYLKKETVVNDLIKKGILKLDDKGYLCEKTKIQGVVQTDSFVRFIVRSIDTEPIPQEVWKDEELVNKYIEYYSHLLSKKDLCYVTGKVDYITIKHPSKVRHSADKGKLISTNDNTNFTYLGRFHNGEQAISVSYEVSQKAHNALRWLIQKQGYRNDGAAIIAWAIDGSEIPNINQDTDELFPDLVTDIIDTGESYARRIKSAINGYKENLDTKKNIVFMSLDAATTGRLSINLYRSIKGSEFLDNLCKWHIDCSWEIYKYKDGLYSYIGIPSPRKMALSAFGNEQSGKLTGNEKLLRNTVERLLMCIIDGVKLPIDIVKSAINKASNPQCMEYYNWIQVLSCTCSLIKKFRYDKYKEVWNVSIDNNNSDRNYLFGRLLSIANRVEKLTYDFQETRETNAMRYMSVFAKKPGKTWKIIYENLNPYFNRLSVGQRIKYQNMIDEVASKFKPNEFNNQPLNELYLLGFYSQNYEFKNKNLNNLNDEEDIDE